MTPMGSRGIDHLVLAVRDLSAAAAFYESLGFTLTPQAQHPFGTGNRLAQLQGGFLELLSVTEPDGISQAGAGEFSFGAYNQDFIARREGMSMIALQSNDWQADRADFENAGLAPAAPFSFGRTAKQPDGSEVQMGFDLTFVPRPAAPDAMFFTCQHRHAPEHFYKPEFQDHANGAQRISKVIIESPDTAATTGFLSALGVDQSLFEIIDGEREMFSGFEIVVTDLSAMRQNSDPIDAFGATLRFCEEKD
jgi:catechol 2,3-dioxygenase-like lactoylglutathione lyase family enzyme